MAARTEDLLRHFLARFGPVVEAEQGRRAAARKEATEREADAHDRSLRMLLLQQEQQVGRERTARQDKEDARREEDRTREEQDREHRRTHPWEYGGQRFKTQEEWLAAKNADREAGAKITAANRPPRAPRATPTSAPQSVSRQRASAEGDAERWMRRNPKMTVDGALATLRKLYPSLSEGELTRAAGAAYQRTRPRRGGGGGTSTESTADRLKRMGGR